MRNLNPASLAKIAQKTGTEPVNIVRIFWTSNGYIDYADRSFGDIQGKVLTLSDIEDVINLEGNSSSMSVNVTLDDVDGSLKQIFNSTDIHRRPVQILQWFTDLPYAEAFVIFEGEIASPVSWNEGDRTLTFDVLSKLYDTEVGFSCEEGKFNYVPSELVGQPWPLVFGTAVGIRALKVDPNPSALLGEDLGQVEEDDYNKQVREYQLKMEQCRNYGLYCFGAAVECYAVADQYAFEQRTDPTVDLSGEISHWLGLGDNYTAQGNQYLGQFQEIQKQLRELDAEQAEKIDLRKNRVKAVGNTWPDNPGSTTYVNINGYTYAGYFDASGFNIYDHPNPFDNNYIPAGITTITEQAIAQRLDTQLSPQRFIFHQSGSMMLVGRDFSVTYIVGLLPLTVFSVEAKRNGIRIVVPPAYYTVSYITVPGGPNGTPMLATLIRFAQPLSSRVDSSTKNNEGWDDEVFVTAISPVGPSPIEIMKWLILTYTPYTWDETSFNDVGPKIATYGMNFALTERPSVLKLLTDLAFQARCAIWYNDRKFFIKFLAEDTGPIETIADTDVDLNSVEVSYTSTEDIVTKFTAIWRPTYAQDKDSKIVFRKNIHRYGTVEQSYDFFAYNVANSVAKIAEFWAIRKATVWKRINFRTFLTKLRIETWDTIAINLSNGAIANGSVNCLVESAKFDTQNWKLVVTAWVPVRAGEMDQFPYALPANLPIEYVYPFVGDTADPEYDEPTDEITITQHTYSFNPQENRTTRGRHQPIGDQFDSPGDFGVNVQLDPSEIDPSLAPVFPPREFSNYIVEPPTDAEVVIGTEPDALFFGHVVGPTDSGQYHVEIVDNPLTGATRVINVTNFSLREGKTIPAGTPVMVHKTTVRTPNTGGLVGTALSLALPIQQVYRMQVPVWIKPEELPEAPGGSSPPPPPVIPPAVDPGAGFGESEGSPESGGSGEEPPE